MGTARPGEGARIGVLVVAYNAATTLAETLDRIPESFRPRIAKVLVGDDHSQDATYLVGLGYQQVNSDLDLEVVRNPVNLGYGGNQKAGYRWAIEEDLDVVVLLHGDGQYAPELLPAIVAPLERGEADAVFGSRMLEPGHARRGGMPLYKYVGNRILTRVENKLAGLELSEWHSGYRAYSVAALRDLPFEANSDGFDFDTEIIIQLKETGKRIVEIPIPTYYGDEICYVDGVKYAKDVLVDVARYRAHKMGFGTGELAFATTAYELKDAAGLDSSHQRLLRWFEGRAPGRVLDLGCSDGRLAERIRRMGHEVTGVDVEKHDGIGERVDRFVEADLEHGIPAEVGAGFDVILGADVFEHVRRPDRLLEACSALLADGGSIVASVPNVAHWYPRARVVSGQFDYDRRGILDSGHLRFFTRRSFEKLAHRQGLKVRRREAVGLPGEILQRGGTERGPGLVARALDRFNDLTVAVWPTLFAYQFIFELEREEALSTTSRIWIGAFLLFFGLAAVWAIGTPVLANPDEPAHAVKATALARGQILPPKLQLPDEGPGSLIRGAFTTRVTVPTSYARYTAKSPECYIWDSTVPADCPPPWVVDETPTEWTTINGRYPPTYYATVGWVTRLDVSSKSLYGMRLVSAVVGSALLATVFWLAARLPKGRLLGIAVIVAATPQVVMMNGSVNPNALEASAGICAWASLCAAVTWPGAVPRSVLAAVAVSCSLLTTTRPLSALWLAIIGLVVLALFADGERVTARLREPGVRLVIGIVVAAGLAGAAWTVFSDDLGNNRGYNPWGLSPLHAAQHSLALTWSYLQQSVAVFGWDRTTSPAPLTWAWGVALLALLVPALRHGDRRRAGVLGGLVVLVLLMPTILQTPVATGIGFVWSGRYGLALAAGIPIVASLILGGRLRAPRLIAATTGLLVAGGHVVAHAAAMRRWTVGTRGPLNYLSGPSWTPPVPPAILLGATVTLAGALALLAFRVAVGSGDRASASLAVT